jgi:hypothetical protein
LLRSLGQSGADSEPQSIQAESEEEEVDGEECEPRSNRVAKALERFDATMRQLTESTQPSDALKAMFNMWLEVTLAMLTDRQDDNNEAESFCRGWLHLATKRCRRSEVIATFDRHLCTVAATLAANVLARAQELPDSHASELVALHELVERYCAGAAQAEFARASLAGEPGENVAEKLRLPNAPALVTALDKMLTTQTFREEVEILLACAAARTLPPEGLAIYETEAGNSLAESLRQQRRVEVVDWGVSRNACPKCHLVLNEFVKRSLENQRIGCC